MFTAIVYRKNTDKSVENPTKKKKINESGKETWLEGNVWLFPIAIGAVHVAIRKCVKRSGWC